MTQRYRNGFLGWFFDAYLLQYALISPVQYLIGDQVDILSITPLFILLAIVIASIIYHTTWKHTTPWISPGEHFIAVKLLDKHKIQTNPFAYHRFLLYAIMVIDLVSGVEVFQKDILLFGTANAWVIVLGSLAINAILLIGAIYFCNARWIGVVCIALFFSIMTYNEYLNALVSPVYSSIYGVKGNLTLMVINVVVGIFYLMNRVKPTPDLLLKEEPESSFQP